MMFVIIGVLEVSSGVTNDVHNPVDRVVFIEPTRSLSTSVCQWNLSKLNEALRDVMVIVNFCAVKERKMMAWMIV